MDVITWIIPIIALVVWIVANLFRVPQDPQKPPARRPRPQPPRPSAQPRGQASDEHPLTDLDRFLQDAKQRREQRERDTPQKSAPPPMVEPVPTVRPAPVPRTRTPQAPPPVPRTKPVVLKPSPARGVKPGYSPDVELVYSPDMEIPQGPPADKVLEKAERALSQRFQPQRRSSTKSANMAEEIMEMLDNPQAARTAFVLREILDRPVSQRRKY